MDVNTENVIDDVINENIIEISEKEFNELNEWKSKYLYLLAEFDNYKKRIAKRDSDKEMYKHEEWFKSVIPFIDDIDRVYANENLSDGIRNVFKNFVKICKDNGLQKLPHDKYFDVNKHNAISTIEQPSLDDNEIVSWVKEGYVYKDKIIRYADVVVNKINNHSYAE